MSFTQGLSGLQAASTDLSVIGNNVANVNTVGFKQSQAQFADVYAASLGGAGGSNNQIGIGAKLATVAQQFSEGNIVSTNNPLDMAINGAGFFIMHGVNGTSYSRNGQFQVDKNGNVVNSTGQNLQGWPATNGIVANGGPTSNLTISNASIPPVATNTIALGLNLDSRAQPISAAFDPLITSTYNYSTSTTVYDSLGNPRLDTMYFQKAAPAVASAGSTAAVPAAVTTNSGTPAAAPNTFTVANTAGLVPGEQVIFSDGFTTTISGVASDGVTFTTAATDPNAYAAGLTASFGPATINNVNSATSFTVDNAYGLSVGQQINSPTLGFPAGTYITSINTTTGVITTSAAASNVTSGAVGIGAAAITDQGFSALNGNTWNVFNTISDPSAPATTPPSYIYPNPAPVSPAWTPIGQLQFNPVNGALTQPQLPSLGQIVVPSFAPQFPSGITYNFAGSTQYGAASASTTLQPNGYPTGTLVGYSAGADGSIIGNYSNNQTQLLGQVALATFANNQGLTNIGDNQWQATTASGVALTGVPGQGLNGVLQTSSVEDSNVDLTAQLVEMMTAQRNYQANAQDIKTQDTIMQTLINMR